MTIAVVDIGNSCLKWAISQATILGDQHRICYHQQNLEVLLNQAWQLTEKPDQIWIASVAKPQITEQVRIWLKTHWQLEPTLVQSTRSQGQVINSYQNPQQLGVDRWLALIGAYHQLQSVPICVVDCGTAITIDVLAATGQHLGGLIVPGIDLMRRALATETFALARFQAVEPGDGRTILLGNDTHSGMTYGTLYAVVGLLEYVLSRLEQQAEKPLTLVLTGGNAPALLPLLQRPYHYSPALVLQGLVVVATEQ
jgi:type III pantothenate kinase